MPISPIAPNVDDGADVRAKLDAAFAEANKLEGITPVPTTRSVAAGGLVTGGGNLSADRTITVTPASDAEAITGTAVNRAMTPAADKAALENRVVPIDERTAAFRVTEDGRVTIVDEDGHILAQADPDKGFGVPGAWFRALTGLLRLGDEDGWKYLRFDPARGWSLAPGVWMRGSIGAGMRLIDVDGFVGFEFAHEGLRYLGQGSTTVASVSAERVWAGALTDDGFQVACDIEGTGAGITRLVVSEAQDFSTIAFVSEPQTPELTPKDDGFWRALKFEVTGLNPDTQYYYGFEVDGNWQVALPRRLKTLPVPGAAAVTRFIFGSCTNIDATTLVPTLRAIEMEENIRFFLHLGDLTYPDISVADPKLPRAHITRRYRSNPYADALNRVLPVVYMPDDHDAVSDGHWDKVFPNPLTTFQQLMRNVRQAYRETVPHYPLVQAAGGEPGIDTVLTQVFDCGVARFIVLDTRSQRRFVSGGTPTTLGNGVNPPGSWDQFSWLCDELVQAGLDGVERVFLCSPAGWVGESHDTWQDEFAIEQAALCDFIRDTPGIPQVTLLTGDLHASAADDGSVTDKSTGGGLTMPQIMSSPIHSGPITLLEPFTWLGAASIHNGNNRYVVMEVGLDGHWSATVKGGPFDSDTGEASILGTYSSADAVPAVEFVDSLASGPAGTPVNLALEKSFFGPVDGCSVDWSTNNGQSGSASFSPNKGKATISVVVPASGSITVTLANPQGCVLGAQTVLTLSAA